jgi:protein translocase SecG subunit
MELGLNIVQIVIGVFLIIAILLQQKGDGLGAAFGGTGDSIISTRRGAERTLFIVTIIFSAIFIGLAIARMFISV